MISPFTNKEMILKTEKKYLTHHGKVYETNYSFYLCEDTKEQFTTTELDELNLKHIYEKL